MNLKIKEMYIEIDQHILQDEKPSLFLEEIYKDECFNKHPFKMLYDLKFTEQTKKYHPEGNVWNHTMLVLDEASKVKDKSKNPSAFMWAALLHDIGKPSTFKKKGEKITAYNHDKVGAVMARAFLNCFDVDEKLINEICSLIRWHMQILYVVKDLPFAEIKKLKQDIDIHELALLGKCDRLGRTGVDRELEENNIKTFLAKCKNF